MTFLPKSLKARRRLLVFALAAPVLIAAVVLSFFAMRGTMVYFYTPAQMFAADVPVGQTIRLGGLVKHGTFVRHADGAVRFTVMDKEAELEVTFTGDLPDLFREGQGVVAEGELIEPALLKAKTILAKHDETYMPKNVKEELERQGEWRPDSGMTEEPQPFGTSIGKTGAGKTGAGAR